MAMYERVGTRKYHWKVSWQNPIAISRREVTRLIPLQTRGASDSMP